MQAQLDQMQNDWEDWDGEEPGEDGGVVTGGGGGGVGARAGAGGGVGMRAELELEAATAARGPQRRAPPVVGAVP